MQQVNNFFQFRSPEMIKNHKHLKPAPQQFTTFYGKPGTAAQFSPPKPVSRPLFNGGTNFGQRHASPMGSAYLQSFYNQQIAT